MNRNGKPIGKKCRVVKKAFSNPVFVSQLIFWSNSKTSPLDTIWHKTVWLPQQCETVSNWTVFVLQAVWKSNSPNSVVSTRTRPKRYYFHSRANQFWTEPFLYPKPSEKVIPNSVVSTRTVGLHNPRNNHHWGFRQLPIRCFRAPCHRDVICPLDLVTKKPLSLSILDRNLQKWSFTMFQLNIYPKYSDMMYKSKINHM